MYGNPAVSLLCCELSSQFKLQIIDMTAHMPIEMQCRDVARTNVTIPADCSSGG